MSGSLEARVRLDPESTVSTDGGIPPEGVDSGELAGQRRGGTRNRGREAAAGARRKDKQRTKATAVYRRSR